MGITASSAGKAAERGPETAVAAAVLIPGAVLAWYFTLRGALEMGNMPGTMGMHPAAFVLMWTVMMAAMMLPSMMPIAALYLRVIAQASPGAMRIARILLFSTGYLAVWAGFGLFAYAFAWLISALTDGPPAVLRWFGAAVLVAGGAYQLSGLKDVCLRHCRSPIGFLFHVGNYRGPLRDLRAGFYHGAWCGGCCAGLMLVMVAAGVMNIAWMIGLAVVILLEKVWRHGRAFARAVGCLLIGTGAALPWFPGLLPGT